MGLLYYVLANNLTTPSIKKDGNHHHHYDSFITTIKIPAKMVTRCDTSTVQYDTTVRSVVRSIV